MSNGRIGVTILVVPDMGAYWWSRPLQIVTYVLHGKSSPTDSIVLTEKENTRLGATRKAARHLDNHLKSLNAATRGDSQVVG